MDQQLCLLVTPNWNVNQTKHEYAQPETCLNTELRQLNIPQGTN